MKHLFINTSVAILLVFSTYAQDNNAKKFSKSITKERAYSHLSVIASDAFEGRETGTRGAWMAAEYIKKQFKDFGLQGPVKDSPDPYFQKLNLQSVSVAKSMLSIDGQTKENLKDYYIAPNSVNAKGYNVVANNILFAGYGLDKKEYNEYEGQDLTDKIVMIFASGDPTDKSKIQKNILTSKIKYLAEHKAAGVLVISQNVDKLSAQMKNSLQHGISYLKTEEQIEENIKATALPMIVIGTKVANQILEKVNTSVDDVKNKIDETLKPLTTNINIAIEFSAARVEKENRAENVLGFLEGSDPKLKNEVLVITAHYDHIGLLDDPNATDKINNGADDDGSGTTGVLMLAEAFSKAKAAGKGPKRSILFMTVVGEEKGLLGSEWYSLHPVFPIENTITDLNIDMIGRGDKDHPDNNFVYIIGSDMLSDDLDKIGKKANKDYVNILLDEKYNNRTDPNRFYYRSDHYNFAKFGIPVIFYFNGVHEDYHQPGDEVSKIDFPMLTKRAKLVYFTAWELANGLHRPVVNKNEDDTLKK